MRKLCTIIAGFAAWLAFSTVAHAKIVEYISQHPVPHKYGGGFCNIEVAHSHNYEPSDPRMYREIGGQYYFVGDPTPFQYEGPRYSYYGAHPVVDAEVHAGNPVYCYMKGPHYHWYQPPPQAQFQFKGGAYWYVGTFPQAYYDERPRFAVVNEVYTPMPYARPVVDIHVAPPVVQAEVAIGGPGWRAGAVIGAPVVVAPPVVGVGVGVGMGVGVVGAPMVVGGPGFVAEPGYYHHGHGPYRGWHGPEPYHGHRGPPPHFGGPGPREAAFHHPGPGRPGPGPGPRPIPVRGNPHRH